MTAYLKPGDRIFICYPGDPSPARDRERITKIEAIFHAAGIEVFGKMGIAGAAAKFEVVAVVRDDE